MKVEEVKVMERKTWESPLHFPHQDVDQPAFLGVYYRLLLLKHFV
jgi:hypothetical protein